MTMTNNLEEWLKESIFDSVDFAFDLVSLISNSFWNNEITFCIMNVVRGITNTIFVVALILMLSNIAQEKALGNPVPILSPVKNGIKGVFFANAAVTICRYMFSLIMQLISSLPIGFLNNQQSSWKVMMKLVFRNNPGVELLGFIPLLICGIFVSISCYAYVYFSMVLFLNLFIHAIGAAFLVPDVVISGDHTGISSWFKTCIVYGLTFLLQSLFFRVGITLLVDFDLTSPTTFLGFVFLLGILLAPKALGKYGYSMGIGSVLKNAAGMAAHAVRFV